MANVLIYSEKTELSIELTAAAQQLALKDNGEVYALAVNNDRQAEDLCARGLKVCFINNPNLLVADIAGMASILVQVASQLGVRTVLLASNRRGKELAGRLAEAWGAGCLTDVKGFKVDGDRVTFTRNALGGATVSEQIIKTPEQVIALSPRAFAPIELAGGGTIRPVDVQVPAPSVKVLEVRSKTGDAVDIQAAERLVIVGQGLEKREHLSLAEEIAGLLGAEIACSKPVASDKKWLPEDRIVGLSGKICKPALALVLGVSGQVQFTVGVREAQVIASINVDDNAYMNQISDYVLVADLGDALPELAKSIK